MLKRMIVLTVVLVVAVALTGCSGSSKTTGNAKDTSDLAARLGTAKTTIDSAETIELSLSTKSLPDGVTGLLSAKGVGNHSPAFKGDVKVVTGGSSLSAKVVAVDGLVYAKTGFSPLYLKINPETLKAPDPAALVATSGGVSDLLPQTTDLKDGGKTRDGSDVLSAIKGTLPGKAVQSLVPSADPTTDFSVTYRLNKDNELHDVSIKGQFYPDGGSITYTVKVSTSDKPVTISKP